MNCHKFLFYESEGFQLEKYLHTYCQEALDRFLPLENKVTLQECAKRAWENESCRRDLSDNIEYRDLCNGFQFALYKEFKVAINSGRLPSFTYEQKRTAVNYYDYPELVAKDKGCTLIIQIKRIHSKTAFPSDGSMRRNRREKNQRYLFDQPDEKTSRELFSILTFVQTRQGIEYLALGFPRHSSEGNCWILPPSDMLYLVKPYGLSDTEKIERKEVLLKEKLREDKRAINE